MAEKKRFCTECGANLVVEGAKFCPECGTPAPKVSAAGASTPVTPKAKASSPKPSERSKPARSTAKSAVAKSAGKAQPPSRARARARARAQSSAKSGTKTGGRLTGALKAVFGKLSIGGHSRRTYLLWGAGAAVVVIAIVLGVVFGLRAAGPSFPANVEAQGLAYEMTSDGPEGSVIEFSVEITRNREQKISVGVSEDEVGGTGDMWRAAAWSAPIAATSILNLNLADYAIDYDVSGKIDGPSAGALMTIATLAGLRGDSLEGSVTMTGTINPDFTVGPVGGIPQKLEGAAEAGKTTVLIPAGQRSVYDMWTEETVDIVERGEELDLVVVEVGDVFEAYEFFTERQIPKLESVDGARPTVSAECYKVLEECVDRSMAQAEDFLMTYSQFSFDATYYGAIEAADAWNQLDECENSLAQGSMGEAYQQAGWAMQSAMKGLLKAVAYDYPDPSDLALQLRSMSPEAEISDVETRLVASSPTTIGEVGCIMDAWGMLASARYLIEEANWSLDRLTYDYDSLDAEDIVWHMERAIEYFAGCRLTLSAAKDNLDLAKVAKGPEIVAPEKADQLAEAYRRASEANLEMLRTTVVPDLAATLAVSEQEAEYFLMLNDPHYLQAVMLTDQMASVTERLPEGPALQYAVLGISFLTFSNSAASLAMQYNYGPLYDFEGNITGFVYDVPLRNALDLARTNAENYVLLADPDSEGTVMPWILIEAGHMFREGTPDQKIGALYCYWAAAAQARTLMMMGGGM